MTLNAPSTGGGGVEEVVEYQCLNAATKGFCDLFAQFPCGPDVGENETKPTYETQFFLNTACSSVADVCPANATDPKTTGTTGTTVTTAFPETTGTTGTTGTGVTVGTTGAGVTTGVPTTGQAVTTTTGYVTQDMTTTGGAETTTGVPIMTTGRATTGVATTGRVTTGHATTGVPTTGVPTTGVPTTGVPTTGVPTTGVPTTGVPTTSVPTTGVPTTGVPTTSSTTTGVPTTGVPTTGVVTTGVSTTGTKPPVCGDGYLDLGEECDDGNLVNDDGCSSGCETEYFEHDYACGDGCLETTVVSVSVPLLHTNMITYAFNKTTDDTCDVSHFVLFDIPSCTDAVSVTSYPPGCATNVDIPCGAAGGPTCDHVGPCRNDWGEFIGHPMKVDIWGNNCSVTIKFTRDLTFKEAPFGLKGGQKCSNCTVLVPEGCRGPPQIFPEFACWWNFGNSTCAAIFNYSLASATVAVVPKGPRNFLAPPSMPGMDNTPVIFAEDEQTMGRSSYWNCGLAPMQTWEVDGETALAAINDPGKKCGDCNGNSIPDPVDIERRTSRDCNRNCIPDECDIAHNTSADNNTNGIPDECEMSGMTPPMPPNDHSPWEPGVIIVIVALSLCVIIICCALFFSQGNDCDEEDDESRRRDCERERRDPLWADASVSLVQQQRGANGGRGVVELGLGNPTGTDTDQSETGGHRKRT